MRDKHFYIKDDNQNHYLATYKIPKDLIVKKENHK